jgi:hypothetical protein
MVFDLGNIVRDMAGDFFSLAGDLAVIGFRATVDLCWPSLAGVLERAILGNDLARRPSVRIGTVAADLTARPQGGCTYRSAGPVRSQRSPPLPPHQPTRSMRMTTSWSIDGLLVLRENSARYWRMSLRSTYRSIEGSS